MLAIHWRSSSNNQTLHACTVNTTHTIYSELYFVCNIQVSVLVYLPYDIVWQYCDPYYARTERNFYFLNPFTNCTAPKSLQHDVLEELLDPMEINSWAKWCSGTIPSLVKRISEQQWCKGASLDAGCNERNIIP